MTKLQWASFTISGLIIVIGVNIWAAKRDYKMLSSSPVVYKQLPVIPFTN